MSKDPIRINTEQYMQQLQSAAKAMEASIEEQIKHYEAQGYKVTRLGDEILVERPEK